MLDSIKKKERKQIKKKQYCYIWSKEKLVKNIKEKNKCQEKENKIKKK